MFTGAKCGFCNRLSPDASERGSWSARYKFMADGPRRGLVVCYMDRGGIVIARIDLPAKPVILISSDALHSAQHSNAVRFLPAIRYTYSNLVKQS